MATPLGSETLTPATPSPDQASRTMSQTDSSAARCRVFRGQKLQLLKDDKLVKSQPQQECIKASSSLTFKYSASRSADCVSESATDTARQAEPATQVHFKFTLSHLHYLERKIKLINSKADSFPLEFENACSRLCRKTDTYTDNLNRRVAKMRSKGIHIDELVKGLTLLNAKRDSYFEDLQRRNDLIYDKQGSYRYDMQRHLELLESRLGPFRKKLDMQLQIMNSKVDSFGHKIGETIKQLRTRLDSYSATFREAFRDIDIFRHIELIEAEIIRINNGPQTPCCYCGILFSTQAGLDYHTRHEHEMSHMPAHSAI